MTPPDEVLSLDVPCNQHAPGIVRAALGRFDSLGWVPGDVMLVASEIVTNAVRHSGCLGEQALTVKAFLTASRMMISVRDPGVSGKHAEPQQPVEVGAGGWGLRIVEQIATRWGADRDNGYHVWAEIAVA